MEFWTPVQLDILFARLTAQRDRLDSPTLDMMAQAYDRAGDVDTAWELWNLAARRSGSDGRELFD